MPGLIRSSKGQVLILMAVALTVLMAIAMLAVDVGTAYVVKTKLNAAVDAASIAAGKSVSQGQAAAKAVAANFFSANFPTGMLGTTAVVPTFDVSQNADNSWTVNVTATATSPTYFAKVAGFHDFTVQANATTRIQTLDLILVMDCSGSIGSALPTLQAAAVSFINQFDAVNDRIGIIHFASGAVTDVAVSATRGFNPTVLTGIINGFSVGGGTTSEEAMRMAKAQLDNNIPSNQWSTLRAIVFFTDGAPNGVAGNFINGTTVVQGDLYSETSGAAPQRIYRINLQDQQMGTYNSIAVLPNTDYTGTVNLASYNNMRSFAPVNGANVPVNTVCNVNRAARNMLENVANAARSEAANPIHIFTIGLGNAMTTQEVTVCEYGNDELGANILQRLANVPNSDTYNQSQPTGVYAFAQYPSQLSAAFNQVATAILRLSK